jgi:Flp pilus assembly protein TadG
MPGDAGSSIPRVHDVARSAPCLPRVLTFKKAELVVVLHSLQSVFRRRGQSGQAMPMLVIFMVVLVGAASLSVDVGHWYLTRAELQRAADAAALAGAAQMPQGFAAAQTAAQTQYLANGLAADTVAYAQASSPGGSPNDSIVVTASRQDTSFFASVLGIGHVTITASARATIQTVSTATNADSIMPWGVMKGQFTYGQTLSLFGGLDQTGNFGAIDLPTSPPGCSIGSGASNYRSNIDGTNTICNVSVGAQLPTETGQMAGPTGQGLTSRIGSNTDTLGSVVQMVNGQAEVIKSSPRLVLVPIITNTDGSTNWPNGKKDILVVGFAEFFVSSYDSKTVTGQFVQYVVNSGDTGGAYQPGGGLSTVALTG